MITLECADGDCAGIDCACECHDDERWRQEQDERKPA